MSEATAAALEQALREHAADETAGGYLTDWLAIAAVARPEDADSTTYITATSDGPLHHRLGLVRYVQLRSERHVASDD